jgi:hypothetical protein
MAAGVKARLPNWQAGREICQNGRHQQILCQTKIFFLEFLPLDIQEYLGKMPI